MATRKTRSRWTVRDEVLLTLKQMKGLTDDEIALALGKHTRTIQNLKRKKAVLDSHDIVKLCNTYALDPSYFFKAATNGH